MRWKKLLVPALVAGTLALGAVSSAAAAGLERPVTEVAAGSYQVAATPSSTPAAPDTETAAASDPEIACALPEAHTALPVLCSLWQGGTLPEAAQRAIGHVIVRLANGADDPSHDSGDRIAHLKELCATFLADHPDADGERVQLCKRILAGGSPAGDKFERMKAECVKFLADHPEADGERVQLCKRVLAGGSPAGDKLERMKAECVKFLADHPDADGARVQLCKRVLAGELPARDRGDAGTLRVRPTAVAIPKPSV